MDNLASEMDDIDVLIMDMEMGLEEGLVLDEDFDFDENAEPACFGWH